MPRASLDTKLRNAVVQRDGGKCRGIEEYDCPLRERSSDASGFHVDHILPVADGGKDELENLQLLCPCCHAVKTKRDADNRNTLAALKRQKEDLKKELRELGVRDKIEREQAEIKQLKERLEVAKRGDKYVRALEDEDSEQGAVHTFIEQCVRDVYDDPDTIPVTFESLRRAFNEWKRVNEITGGSFELLKTRIHNRYGHKPIWGRRGWTNFKLVLN
jgi:hypothetical protein